MEKSILNKKHVFISYQLVREVYSYGAIDIAFDNGKKNLVDASTNLMTGTWKKESIQPIFN